MGQTYCRRAPDTYKDVPLERVGVPLVRNRGRMASLKNTKKSPGKVNLCG